MERALRGVHALVRQCQEVVQGDDTRRRDRDQTQAPRERNPRITSRVDATELGGEAREDRGMLIAWKVGRDHDVFVAAQPRDGVGSSERRPEHVRG